MVKPGRKPGSIPWNKGLTAQTDSRVSRPWAGKRRAPETIAKIRLAKVGFRHTEEAKQKIAAAAQGRSHSPEVRARIAEAMRRVGLPQHLKGMNSRQWKRGCIRVLRRLVLERDRAICQVCGAEATEVDHVLPVRSHPERRFDLGNLQSLCHACHRAKTNHEINLMSLSP